MGIMEKKMETSIIMGYSGLGVLSAVYREGAKGA